MLRSSIIQNLKDLCVARSRDSLLAIEGGNLAIGVDLWALALADSSPESEVGLTCPTLLVHSLAWVAPSGLHGHSLMANLVYKLHLDPPSPAPGCHCFLFWVPKCTINVCCKLSFCHLPL